MDLSRKVSFYLMERIKILYSLYYCKLSYPKVFTKIWVRRDFGLYIARPEIDQSEFCNSTIFSVY